MSSIASSDSKTIPAMSVHFLWNQRGHRPHPIQSLSPPTVNLHLAQQTLIDVVLSRDVVFFVVILRFFFPVSFLFLLFSSRSSCIFCFFLSSSLFFLAASLMCCSHFSPEIAFGKPSCLFTGPLDLITGCRKCRCLSKAELQEADEG